MKQTKDSEEKMQFFTHFSYSASQSFEKADSKPDSCLVPGQAIRLRELFDRFNRGQRLNVHLNPMNEFYPEDVVDQKGEHFSDCPPEDIHDIVDVERYQNELNQRKRDLADRMKSREKKKEEAQQAQQAQAQQAQQASPTNQ